ncbi:hypothetical protein IAU60_003522 [Kwoniella sp. DSM 27419]
MAPPRTSSESEPLLPLAIPGPANNTTPTRSRLSTRRYTPSTSPVQARSGSGSSNKGKGRASEYDVDVENDAGLEGPHRGEVSSEPEEVDLGLEEDSSRGARTKSKGKNRADRERGRHATIMFSNESEMTGGNLDLWVEEGESVGSVKEKIKALRPALYPLNLRLIHSGRLLTDGILLLPWLRSIEERVRRQAKGVGGEVESVLKEVGLADDDEDGGDRTDPGTQKPAEKSARAVNRVWLHCIVGGKEERTATEEAEPAAPRRRGFDVLLDAGLSPEDVALMRRQFYESRGEEVPEGMDLGDINDEHARALEEQWIEGDMTAETATTTSEGLYTSILHGLLTGFMFPLIPWFFLRELPLPNFFDAEAEAARVEATQSASLSRPATSGDRPVEQAAAETTDSDLGTDQPSQPSTLPTQAAPAQEQTRAQPTSASDVISRRVAVFGMGPLAQGTPGLGSAPVSSEVYGKRMQMGILLGTLLNLAFGALRLLN